MTNDIHAAIRTVAREIFGEQTEASYETLLANLETREAAFNRLHDLLTVWRENNVPAEIVPAKPEAPSVPFYAAGQEIRQGMYRKPGAATVYKVQPSQAGRLYAKELRDGHFEYARGAIFEIKSEWRMTAEEISQWGLDTGNCLVCQRELTVPESVRRGIGPICYAKYC